MSKSFTEHWPEVWTGSYNAFYRGERKPYDYDKNCFDEIHFFRTPGETVKISCWCHLAGGRIRKITEFSLFIDRREYRMVVDGRCDWTETALRRRACLFIREAHQKHLLNQN